MGEKTEVTPPVTDNKEVDGQQADASIPIQRFTQVNDRMKTAEAEVARLRAELAARTMPAPAPAAAVGSEDGGGEPKTRTPQGQIGDADRLERLELQVRLGVSEEAASLVTGFLRKGLDQDEALALARMKNPGAFGPDVTKRGFQPGTHSATPPGTGRTKVQVDEPPTRTEQLAAVRGDLHRRSDLAVKFASDMVREQMDRQMNRNR